MLGGYVLSTGSPYLSIESSPPIIAKIPDCGAGRWFEAVLRRNLLRWVAIGDNM